MTEHRPESCEGGEGGQPLATATMCERHEGGTKGNGNRNIEEEERLLRSF